MVKGVNDEVFMEYMQNIFITLWTTLYHRNRVVHEEKQPNPLEIVLAAQSLYCRYKEAYSINYGSNNRCIKSGVEHNTATRHCQLLIKVAGVRNSKCNRSAWAYEAKDLHGVIKLYGVASNNANSTNGAVQEALTEAVITAKNYRFHRILLLTNNKNLVQLLHRFKNPAWHERSLITDMEIFYQSGLVCNLLVVPKCVLDFVYVAAKLAIHKLCIFLSL